jgi:hypothetical protein
VTEEYGVDARTIELAAAYPVAKYSTVEVRVLWD